MPELVDLPLERFCNYVWWLYTRDGDQKEVDKFKIALWRPPKGVEVTDTRSPWSAASEQKAFGSLKASLGMTGKTAG
jgi:hypothetical protein